MPSAGSLKTLQKISTLPKDFKGTNTAADVHVHPSGKFLYGSNRGHDSIACFAIDAKTGELSLIGYTPTQGKNPRNFAIDPSGTFPAGGQSGRQQHRQLPHRSRDGQTDAHRAGVPGVHAGVCEDGETVTSAVRSSAFRREGPVRPA